MQTQLTVSVISNSNELHFDTMSIARARVLAGFRRLNRARIQLFEGDDFAMNVSRQQMRAEFEKNRNIPTSGPEFEVLVAGIDEAADMLMNEIVRGKLNDETGRYGKEYVGTPAVLFVVCFKSNAF